MNASFTFRPAATFAERRGLFVALSGSTNSGKTFSALRLARGIAGPSGKIAVVDTEGGRTLHLKDAFAFDANVMSPPFRPGRFAEAAEAAEDAGYDVMLIDSFSMEWAGVGGVLDWHDEELQRMAGDDYGKRERMKMAAWIKPKVAHKQMVLSFLNRRIPIIFSIRGEETVKPGGPGQKPEKVFKAICNNQFPYELTLAFRLAADRKGIIDLSDPNSWKMEGAHQAIFRDGEQLSEDHGAKLAAWARGGEAPISRPTAKPTTPQEFVRETIENIGKIETDDDIHAWVGSQKRARLMDKLRGDEALAPLAAEIEAAESAAFQRLAALAPSEGAP